MQNITDEDLVRLAQRGDTEAFSQLTCRHNSWCLRLAVSILRQREQAEDEVQNAWWNAWTHIGQFHSDARFSTWMTRIVVNQCLMRLRQLKRTTMVLLDDQMELPSSGISPEEGARTQETAALLGREIGRIPPLLRHAFVLRDVEELPMPEVAKRLGISVAAAKSRLLRARAELRARLTRATQPAEWNLLT